MDISFNKTETEIEVLPDFTTMLTYTKTKDSLVIAFRSAEEIERLMKLEQASKPVYTLDPHIIEWMSARQEQGD